MLGSTSSSNNEYTKKLTIMLSGAVGAFAGMEKFRAAFAEIDKLQKGTAVSAAKAAKEAQAAESKALREREAARKQLAVLESRLDMEELKRRQFVESGKVTAAERSTLRIAQLNDARVLSEKRANDAILAGQAAANRRSLAQQKQHSAALRGLIAGGLSTAGTGLIAGGAGILAGGYGLVNSAMNWQSFVSQQLANSPMSGAQARQLQSIALRQAAASGASPQDILLAGRYGIERGLPMGLTTQTLNAAMMLGLPSGGTQQLAPAMQAIITGMKNNPTLMNNPKLVAGMILTAAQNSAGTTVPQFVNAIPQTLTLAGHFGVKNFPQVLAAISAMTQAGVPIEEANTGVYNLLARIATPSPGVQKTLARLKNSGIDLTGDFSSTALGSKGIMGVLSDIRNANLSPTTLNQLFPRLRAFLPALGLTGNYANSFFNIQGKIASGQGNAALNADYKRYLNLPSTQAAKLQRTFQDLAIVMGTALLPGFIALEKELIPLAKNFSAWVKEHKDLLVELMKLAPYMIGFGLGLKGLGLMLRVGGSVYDGVNMFKLLLYGTKDAAAAAKGEKGIAGLIKSLAGEGGLVGAAGGASSALFALAGVLGLLAFDAWQVYNFIKNPTKLGKGNLTDFSPSKQQMPAGMTGWETKNFNTISSLAAGHAVPTSAVLAVLGLESSGGTNPHKGAYGLTGIQNPMQIDPRSGMPKPSTPQQSIEEGAQLLRTYYLKYGNWLDAFAAYNGGPYAVSHPNSPAGRAAFSYAHKAVNSMKGYSVNYGRSGMPAKGTFGLTNVSHQWDLGSHPLNAGIPTGGGQWVTGHTYDFTVKIGEPVYLPGNKNNWYWLVNIGTDDKSGLGMFETWRTPNGGYFVLSHLSEVLNPRMTEIARSKGLPGGSYVGRSGASGPKFNSKTGQGLTGPNLHYAGTDAATRYVNGAYSQSTSGGGNPLSQLPSAGGGDTGGGFTLPATATGSKKPTTPSGWSSYWSGKADKDKKVLSELVGPYTDPKTGKVNWKAMPKAVRQAADALINQISGEEFMAGRGTLNADVSNPKVRGPLMSQLWNDTVGARVHPEGWWDTTGGVLGKMPKSSTAGSTAVGHVVPVHIIGRCKAEEANRKHLAGTHGVSKATLHEIKTTGQRLDHIATILISIDRSVRGGDRVTRPAPRQGSYVAPIIHSR